MDSRILGFEVLVFGQGMAHEVSLSCRYTFQWSPKKKATR